MTPNTERLSDEQYQPAGDPRELWNSPLHTLQERLEICAGAVEFERAVAANMRRQRDEVKAILATLPSGIEADGDGGKGLPFDPEYTHGYLSELLAETVGKTKDPNIGALMQWLLSPTSPPNGKTEGDADGVDASRGGEQ